MIRVPPEALHSWSTEVLAALGVPDNDATHIARCLIDVDLRGVRSHGTRQLRRYVKEFRNGLVNTTPVIRVLRETDHSLRLDGDGGAGYLVASRATDSTCDKTNAVGLAVAATCNHGHVGSAGIYARRVLSHGFIGWCVAGGAAWNRTDDPDATVWDAMRAPPMCFAVPSDDGGPPTSPSRVQTPTAQAPEVSRNAKSRSRRFSSSGFTSLPKTFLKSVFDAMV